MVTRVKNTPIGVVYEDGEVSGLRAGKTNLGVLITPFPVDSNDIALRVKNPYNISGSTLTISPEATSTNINAAISEYLQFNTTTGTSKGGTITFIAGEYRNLNSTIFIPANVSVLFEPGAKIYPSVVNTYTDGYLFMINTLNGNSWIDDLTNVTGAFFEGAFVDNSAAPQTVVKLLALGAPHRISNCHLRFCHGFVSGVSNYLDKLNIEHFHIAYPQGDDYQIRLRNLGDGLRIASGEAFKDGTDTALMIHLIGCQGGIVDSCVQGVTKFTNCRAISMRGRHGENQGQTIIENSDVTISQSYFWAQTTPRILCQNTTRRTVKLVDVVFNHNLNSTSPTPGFDIQTDVYTDLVINDTYRVVSSSGNISTSEKMAPRICIQDGSTPLQNFSNYSYALSHDCKFRGDKWSNGTVDIYCGSGAITSGFPAPQLNNATTWKAATGTYYYQAAIVWDVTRQLGRVFGSAERSISATNGGNGVLIPASIPRRSMSIKHLLVAVTFTLQLLEVFDELAQSGHV